MKNFLFILLAGLPTWSFAIKPFVITLDSDRISYTVPEKKMLLIVTAAGPSNFYRMQLVAGSKEYNLSLSGVVPGDGESIGYATLLNPFRVPEKVTIRLLSPENCTLYCFISDAP